MTKKHFFILCTAAVLAACAKQTTHSLYQTGRPLGVAANNAKIIVANNWGFQLNYIGAGNATLDQKIKFNDSVNNLLTEEFGENWQDKFTKESNDEVIINDEIRKTVKSTTVYKKAENDLFQPTILLSKKGDAYLAHIVGQQKSDDIRTFITYAQLLVSLDGTSKIKSDKIKPLTMRLPVNGIE